MENRANRDPITDTKPLKQKKTFPSKIIARVALPFFALTLVACSDKQPEQSLNPTPDITLKSETASTNEPSLQWMSELRLYSNKEIPSSLVKQIATDMANSNDYPSLASSGKLILDQYDNPKKAHEMLPFTQIANPFPMKFIFTDQLDAKTRAFLQIDMQDITQELELLDRSNSQIIRFMGVKAISHTYDIFLNTHLITINTSQWSYKLLLAKETSHLLYLNQQMDDVWNSVTQTYDIKGGEETKPILLETAYGSDYPQLRVPSLGSHFDRAREILDYAAYWHINLDVLRLNQQGKLTSPDQKALEANIALAELSLTKGLVVSDNMGVLRWKEGVGPFSDDWIRVADEVLTDKSRR